MNESSPSAPRDEGRTGYTVGRFVIDLTDEQLRREDEAVPLSPKAFLTLKVLVERRNRTVTKEELIQAVWPDSNVSDESLTQNIFSLRRAFGDDSNRPAFIATIPRKGYRFIAAVTEWRSLDAPAAPPADVLRPSAQPAPPPRPATRTPLVVVAAILLLAAVATSVWVMRRGSAPNGPTIRFTVAAPAGTAFVSGPLLSPDGRNLAFIAREVQTGRQQLWLATLELGDPKPLAGTEGATDAFWSPGNDSLAFFSGNRLRRIGLTGAIQTIADAGPDAAGGSWHANGTILFSEGRSGIYSVPASGGTPRAVTSHDRAGREWTHRRPQWLPDGERFIFSVVRLDGRSGTYLSSVDGDEKTLILDDSARDVRYVAPGYLIYLRDGDVTAQRFDDGAGRLSGEPLSLTGAWGGPFSAGGAPFTASANGLLAYGGAPRPQLAWLNRDGTVAQRVETPVPLRYPTLFADDARLLGNSLDGARGGVWQVDTQRASAMWSVPDGAVATPAPGGARFAFSSARRAGVADIYLRSTDGSGGDELLLQTNETKTVQDWSPDERYLVYSTFSSSTQSDVWALPLSGDRRPVALLQSSNDETQPRVSPDGRWLAYASDESGAPNVYLQSFPAPGRKITVSAGGGSQPVWRRDGRELFYLSDDRSVMAVGISGGTDPRPGVPRKLFATTLPRVSNSRRPEYAVSSDGQRFLMNTWEPSEQAPITVILNWERLLQR